MRAAAVCLLAALLGAEARAGEADHALSCVRTKAWEAYGDGWSVRAMRADVLAVDGRITLALSLVPGRSYRVVGCGTEAAADVDLVLYDAGGRVVARDAREDRQPEVDLPANRGGAHYLVAHLRGGAGTAGVAVAVLHR